jgi:PAS domain S-box-containing protein
MGSGQPEDIYAETLAVFDQNGRYEPLTTPEVTEALDVERRTVYKRLQKLVDRGELETKEAGSNARVWWRPPEAGIEGSSGDGEPEQNTDGREHPERWSVEGYREIFEAMPDGVLLHDPADGTIIDANEQFCAMLGYSREELLALDFEAVHTDIAPYTMERAKQYIQQAATEGPQTFEWLDETKSGEHIPVEVHLRQTTIDDKDCILGVVRDISDRKEQEQEVQETAQQLQGILDTVEAAIFLKDTDGQYLLMNQNYRSLVGIEADETVTGVTDEDLFPEAVATRHRANDEQVFETNETIEIEEEIPTPDGDRTVLMRKTPIFDEAGDPYAVCAVATDITERKDREEELRASRRFNEELVENAPFGMFRLDEDLRITYENPRAQEIIGLPEEMDSSDAIGVDIRELPSIQETGQAEMFTRLAEGETIEFEFPFESIYGKEAYFSGRGVPLYRDGKFDGAVLMANDISDRRQREEALRAAREFNEELVENAPFGTFRLDDELRITYENPRAEEIIGLPEEMDSSDGIGVDIRELPPIIETGQAEIFSRLAEGETIEFEFPFESIYGKEAYFTGRSVPLYRDGEFDGAVLMANDISDHRERERELERQREQLAAVNELNDVVRGITEAVIDQSTRSEIEQVVCDKLAASDSYRFAWISSIGPDRQLKPSTKAGIDVHLDDIPLSADPSDPTGQGPIGNAVRSQEVHVRQNVLDETEETDREYLFQSAAAIPIVHQEVLYGVLAIYSERPDAFAEEEREVVGQLGEVVGHAIAAVNRKRALMSSEVIELEIQIPELLDSADGPAITEGPVTIERAVPLGGDEYLVYGTTNKSAMAEVEAVSEQLPDVKAVRRIDESDDRVRFEQHLSNPPVSSTIADYGGYFESGRIEDGEYVTSTHLPPGTDIRQVVSDIQNQYPDAKSVSHRQVTRDDRGPGQLQSILTEKLTDRQRAALEAGYYGGFFDWPRDRSGEDVATSLGIGASTFHQHVRKAEKKLLDVVFTETG